MLLWQVPTKELTTLLFQYEGLGKYSTQNDKWKMVSQLPQGVWTVCTKQSSSLLQWHSYLLPPYKIDKNPVCHIALIKKCMFTSELPIFHNFLVKICRTQGWWSGDRYEHLKPIWIYTTHIFLTKIYVLVQ